MKKKNDLNEARGDEMDCKKERGDELEVEAYSPHELKSKKRGISTRVAIAGVVVVAAIGIAGLTIRYHYSNELGNDENVVQTIDEDEKNVVQTIDENKRNYTDYSVLGGSGSWFLSRMERFDG